MRKLLLFVLLLLVWLMPAQGGMSLEFGVPVLSGAELVETEGGHHYATWYRNRHYSSELAGKSVDKSSPSDNCFYGGKNLVVYNQTLQSRLYKLTIPQQRF